MKYVFSFFVIFSISHQSTANDKMVAEVMAEYVLRTSLKDEKLSKDEAVFEFNCNRIQDNSKSRTIRYSVDGVEAKQKLKDNLTLTIRTTPGKHKFMFYYNSDYSEIITDSVLIKPGYRDVYDLYFYENYGGIKVEKPVIYLYPEKTRDISVKLNVKGDLAFSYPIYDDGWKFIASPNGDLTFGENTYNYLFWETSLRYVLSAEELKTGFNVSGDESLTFLEEKLAEAGLNSKEKTDFITFWGPRLIQNELNFVHFKFNKECDDFANLKIAPKPKEVYRIYMLWSPIDLPIATSEQEIKPITRKGFTVVEWGGSELSIDINSL
jgi:hypothetical protein